MNQQEAAASRDYWFTRWHTGEIVLTQHLEVAILQASSEARRVVFHGPEPKPTGFCIVIFKGKEAVAQVEMRELSGDRNPWVGWSPGNLHIDDIDITPEEYAHLIKRRSGRL